VKLGLGTVQFGVNYGLSNAEGQTSVEEAFRILEVASENGIQVIDTATLYGSSEEVLGEILPDNHAFKLVTKTARIDARRITPDDASRLEQTFVNSLNKLRSPSIYGLMIHNAEDVLAENGTLLMEKMIDLKRQGLVAKIGVSVYNPLQVDKILEKFNIDLVQIPLNVLDQRMLIGGQTASLKKRGVEIHVRSAFLQGLLLMRPETLPRHFDPVRKHLAHYNDFLQNNNLSPVQAALGFLATCNDIDVVVCGVNNHLQLHELCLMTEPLPNFDFSEFKIDDDLILNPSKWPSNS
jgi:aryl-alcohol dehydrogenase-like predicted oxidoreductase